MTRQEYQEKLMDFNSTEKYQQELSFLIKLLDPKLGQKILDYGCGIGTAVRYIINKSDANCFGYDVNNYRIDDDPFIFRDEFYFQFDKIFFMHSFAHIPDIEGLIKERIKQFLYAGGYIVAITPNRNWTEVNRKEDYIADPSVIKHWTLKELENLFLEGGYKIICNGQFGEYSFGCNERLFLIAQK